MLDARFSHLYFCQSLYTLQRGLPAIVGLLVTLAANGSQQIWQKQFQAGPPGAAYAS